jgi:hypothetical protein
MIIIKSIECSGGACPYQIEATTDDGRHFYLRYRWGHLRASCHKDPTMECQDYNVISEQIGDPMDGVIDHDKVVELLKDKVKFPDGFIMNYSGSSNHQEEDDRS